MSTIKIASYAEQTLNENYKQHVSKWDEQNPDFAAYSISEWADLESQNDPDFYRWILNDPNIADFGSNLSDDENQMVSNFIQSL